MTESQLLESLNDNEFSFIDFGCSAGNSVSFIERKFPGNKGIGIDIDEAKLAACRENDIEAAYFDLTQADLPGNCVNFVSMFHVLEHLPDEATVTKFLRQAVRASKYYVLIRFPYFDADAVLASKGHKFYHSDWTGHTLPISSYQLFKLIKRASGKRVKDFYIYGRQPITEPTSHIIPINSPANTSRAAAETYPPFDPSGLPVKLYKELAAIIRIDRKDDRGPQLDPLRIKMKLGEEDLLLQHQAPQAETISTEPA